jgi:hypothetical protein
MHPGSFIYVGFGGFTGEVDFPEAFIDAVLDGKVLTKEGDSVEFEMDGDEIGSDTPAGEKFFRKIRDEFDCYGFQIASYDTAEEIDLAKLSEEAARWMPFAIKIGERYGFTCQPRVCILSDYV